MCPTSWHSNLVPTWATKLGAKPLAVFEADGGTYHFLAFSFHQQPG